MRCFAYVGLALLGRDEGVIADPIKLSLRGATISTLIFGFVSLTAYNAKLVSILAVKKVDFPISSLANILDDGNNAKLIIQLGSNDESYFKNAQKGTIEKELWEKNIQVQNYSLSVS